MPAWDPRAGEIWVSVVNPAGRSACFVILSRDERGIEVGHYRGTGLFRTIIHGLDATQIFLLGHRYVPLLPGMPREVINFLENLASENTSWTLQSLLDKDPYQLPLRDVWAHLMED